LAEHIKVRGPALSMSRKFTRGKTVGSVKAIVKLNAGQTVTRTLTFKVAKSSSRGTYEFSSTASDVAGTVSSSATFTVS